METGDLVSLAPGKEVFLVEEPFDHRTARIEHIWHGDGISMAKTDRPLRGRTHWPLVALMPLMEVHELLPESIALIDEAPTGAAKNAN